jgi:murein DD-endopeptidase MepM/ murein hydrolase activator NlpD
MNALVKAGLVLAAAPLLCAGGLVALAATTAGTNGCLTPGGSSGAVGGGGPVGSWDADQNANAVTIVRVGAQLQVPRRGWVIAVATAIQESGLRNLGNLGTRNDHDSLGLFQQRPSQGWGTPAQLTDPVYAATAFYRALLRVPDWQTLPLTVAAQSVQRSAFPDAYARHEAAATALVDAAAAHLGLPACAGGWVLPLPAGSYRVSSGYGPRGGTFHYGTDFAAPTGTPIYAAAAGPVVTAACTSPFRDRPGQVAADGTPLTPGCGLEVQIQPADAIVTTYCHAQTLTVHTGQTVTAGQVIGTVGSTGNSTGSHLHFQAHRGAPSITNATTVDPLPFPCAAGRTP